MSDTQMDDLLAQIIAEMRLDRDGEREVVDELRAHLEEAIASELSSGATSQEALRRAAARFGVTSDIGREMQAAHAGWGTSDAVMAAALPVLLGLVLRWLVYAPDGSAVGWSQLLARPTFWVVALATLVVPLIRFPRWRYALVSWSVFWLMTVIFVTGATVQW